MPINTNLLIMAPVLQDLIIDKDTCAPLANGFISLFIDNDRTTFKNWYYQTGTPGNYTFLPLDNPLNLSSCGTIQDPNGNDVIPFFYPYDESITTSNVPQTYFIQVNSSNPNGTMGALQFTRENFPFTPSGGSVGLAVPTLRNYIVNNEFWRNVTSETLNKATTTSATNLTGFMVAPSQHDGFRYPDIQFVKNGDGTDILTFTKFTSDNALQNEVSPEYYLNVHCTAAGTDTIKYLRIPISLHLQTLSGVTVSISFQGQNVGGAPNNTVYVAVVAETGTEAASPPLTTFYQTFTLGSAWSRNIVSAVPLPSVNSPPLATSVTGDDAFYLLLGFPTGLSTTFNINIAKPEIYLSKSIPNNDFDTYDQIDPIINGFRTGDFRTSLNSSLPGWVAANDGVISNSGTFTAPTGIYVSRRNIDTWPLFKLIWENVNPVFAPIYDSAGTSTTRGGSAYDDWNGNKQLQLTRSLGRALLGLPPVFSITSFVAATGFFTVASPQGNLVEVGAPVTVTPGTAGVIPSEFTAGTIYYMIPGTASTFRLALNYLNALNGIPITGADDGTLPFNVNVSLGGTTGEQLHTQTTAEVGPHVHPPLAPSTTFVTAQAGGPFTITAGPPGGVQEILNTGINSNGGNPFNIIQPSVYYNVFIKL